MCVVFVVVVYMCAKLINIVASQQLHPNVVVVGYCIVCMVVSVKGYSIRRELSISAQYLIS